MHPITETFGMVIKQERKKQNISQCKLADKTNMYPANIGEHELGKKQPRLDTFCKFAIALGMTPVELMKLCQDYVDHREEQKHANISNIF